MEQAIMAAAAMVGAGVGAGLAAIGAGVGDGLVTGRYIEGISRQPEARGVLFIQTLISVGLIEALAIIAVVVGLILLFANPFIK